VRANPPEHVRFRIEVFVLEQCGYASDTGYQDFTSSCFRVGARQCVSSEVAQLKPTRDLDPMFVNLLMHFPRNECRCRKRCNVEACFVKLRRRHDAGVDNLLPRE
jgi:hypothetical protein